MGDQGGQEADKNIEIWKIKRLIKGLEAARGNGTSMISLIMPPRDQVSRVAKMLGDEYGTASNIKNRVNRQSVLGAITSAQQRLKLYNKVNSTSWVFRARSRSQCCLSKRACRMDSCSLPHGPPCTAFVACLVHRLVVFSHAEAGSWSPPHIRIRQQP